MSAREDEVMNFLKDSDPASDAFSARSDSPDFARLHRVRMARKLSVGFAVLAAVAFPVVTNFVGRGSDNSQNQLAEVSNDGLKGAAKQSNNQAGAAAQTVTFSGAPDLELNASPTEQIGADQKFRSSRDGFSFANYAGPPTNDQIDATTMAALFGKAAVCADPAAALCVMLPGAQAVADQLNEAMASGRCEGMSVLAQRYFDGFETRPGGVTATAQLSQDSVAKQIGYWWATQVAPSVSANSKQYRAMTPTQITNELINGLRSRSGFTLGLYSAQGGHSVTPIAVTKDGSSFNIYVYDNNYPSEIRKVVIDSATQSWTYGSAALNSGAAASTWTGSGAGTMDLTAMATRQGPFKVSLGATKGLKGTSYMVIVTQKDNTTKPVGFKLNSRFGEINSLDPKSVSKAEFPVKSFLGAGVGQGAIAYIPTVFAEESGLNLEIVGGEKTGKYTFSVMRTGAAGVVVQSDSKFEISVANTALNTEFAVDLADSSSEAFVQLSSGNSGSEIQLTDGQSMSVVTTVLDDDALLGSRRIEYPKSTFEVFAHSGKSLVSGLVETKLKNGQAKITRLSVDSDSGLISQSVREIVGVKVDNKFIKQLDSSVSTQIFDNTSKKPKAELIDTLVPIQLPMRAIATPTTTTVADVIQFPTRAIAATTTTSTTVAASVPPATAPATTTPATEPPVTAPPSTTTTVAPQSVTVTLRAQRFYGDLNGSIAIGDWEMTCVDSSSTETGCNMLEDAADTTPMSDLMSLSVELDQMAKVKMYSSESSSDLSAEMKPMAGWPSNYSANVIVELTVVQRPVTVSADAKSKIYGANDPALTYQSSGLVGTDSLTGSLSRASGENVGTYSINQGSLANSNYAISFTGADFEITKKTLTVTADAKSKVYGANDPALTYQSSGLVGTDSLTGALSRTGDENVGTYAINQGDLSAGSNYSLSFNSANLTITKKEISVVIGDTTRVYGSSEPAFSVESVDGLVGVDTEAGLNIVLSSTGVIVGDHDITGTFSNLNYDVKFTDGKLTITAKSITVTADAKSKVYGDNDPALTYQSSGLVGTDSLTGGLARIGGDAIGTYAINQ
ncbi:MAG: MBG domain-containing protein, partial [Ilumatobacteraceae bacterium]